MKLKTLIGSISYSFLLCFILILQGCNTATLEQKKTVTDSTTQKLIEVNRYMLKNDEVVVKEYIKRHGYNMKQTESGLYYQIFKSFNGKAIKIGNEVTIKYKVELPDGTLCYSSDSTGNKTFIIGSGRIETGLDEGVQLLKKGDKACLILFPHLAFGMLGDNKRIPPRATIIYTLEIVDVK